MSNPIQIRNTIIGTGRPKICIPLVDETLEGLERSAAALRAFPCDLVEWRADFFEKEADPVCRKEALSLLRELLPGTPLLFTIRTKEEGGMYQKDRAEYVRAILEVIQTGLADLVDAELSCGEDRMKEILQAAHEKKLFVVGSRHNFVSTPPKEELVGTMRRMQTLVCDLVKYAVMPQCERDVLTLLDASLTMKEQYPDTPVITMSMGRLGAVSRICGELSGSAVTFGSAGASSAPGQLPADRLAEILNCLSL